jgi:hypothetical protein
MSGNQGTMIQSITDNNGDLFKTGVIYNIKIQVKSADGIPDIFRLKLWPESSTEPSQWQLEGSNPDSSIISPVSGSLLIVAHHADVTYKSIEVIPLLSLPENLSKLNNEDDLNSLIPDNYELGQNYPNPFNPSTNIRYALPFESSVRISVYNILGQEVGNIVEGVKAAGYYSYMWQPNGLSSGIYIYRFEAKSLKNDERFVSTKKMVFLK